MAASADVVVRFVQHKVSAVCWEPVIQGSMREPEVFASGSWDNGMDNKISVWRFVADMARDDSLTQHDLQLLCDVTVPSGVTDAKFLDSDHLVVSFHNGSVAVYKYESADRTLVPVREWDGLHSTRDRPYPCTSVAISVDGAMATSGEDNKLTVLQLDTSSPVKTIEHADVGGINAVAFSQAAELLSVSLVGHLKVWDLRIAGNKSTKTMIMPRDCESLHCVQRHPTHPHLVVTGRGDGSLCFWDLRHHQQPVSIFAAHTDTVWDVQFHPSDTNHLFTCSNDGSLLHWDASYVTADTAHSIIQPEDSLIAPWLTGEVLANGMDIVNLHPNNTLPVNSVAMESRHLLAGVDNEALVIVPNLSTF